MEGRCLCGAVRLDAAGDPLAVRACWCRDCQYVGAGGPTTNAFFRTEDLTIAGGIVWYESVADSGNVIERGFCPACGTPVSIRARTRPHLVGARVGVFERPEAFPPASIIWTGSAPGWACLDPALPRVEGQPPPLA